MNKEKITFKNSKGQNLVGILHSPDSKGEFPIAIYCSGYRSTKESSKIEPIAEHLASNGISLFAFDFSGRGESDGKFEDATITQYIDDLKCIVDSLSKLTSQIGVVGNSLGGLVALQEVSRDERVKTLALISPVSRFPWRETDEFAPENVKRWKEQGYTFTESKRFGKMRINYSFYEDGINFQDYTVYENIKIPVLVVHGTADKSASIEDSKKLVTHLEKAKLVPIKGADHNYTRESDFDRMAEKTTKFLIEQLK